MDKQQLRKTMEAKRQLLSEEERRLKSESIIQYVLKLIAPLMQTTAKPTLFAFVPFRSEVNMTGLMQWWWEAGYQVVVPKVDKSRMQMDAYIVNSLEELEPGAWGILEPRFSSSRKVAIDEIRVMVIPGLAFDRQGGRLGYGSGIYDRFLEQYEDSGIEQPFKLGVCFEAQLVEELPIEQHDIRVDRMITEKGVYDIIPHKSS